MVKICILGIVTVLICQWLKSIKSEVVPYVGLACVLITSGYIFKKIEHILSDINEIMESANIEAGYMTILIKMLGITYISEISEDMCKDAGFNMIGNQIEIFAKLSMLTISIPVIKSLINTIFNCFA